MIKNRFHYYRLANDILLGTLIANILGDQITRIFFSNRDTGFSQDFITLIWFVDMFYLIIACIIAIVVIVSYESPVRNCLKSFYKGRRCDPEMMKKAQRRLLNEPYLIIVLNILIWTVGTFVFWLIGSEASHIGVACGMVTVILAFFWVEHVSQKKLIPIFFPDGGLAKVKGAKTLGLGVRIGAWLLAVSIIPLSYIYITTRWFREQEQAGKTNPGELLEHFQFTLIMESSLFILLAVGLSILVVKNFRAPLQEIIQTMTRIKKGDFTARAKVLTNDEIGFVGETLNAMAEGLGERELIKDTFGKYIDRRVRDEILNGNIPLDGEIKEATILFADLRDFTPMAATTPPKTLIRILNGYLDEMSGCIQAHQGLILQFIGDEIEAVFGAPVYESDHVASALRAAIDMQSCLEKLNRRHRKMGFPVLKHGIGIHTGTVLAANIGSRDRMAYSLVGETVNMASRIQGLNKKFQTDILVSHDVAQSVKGEFFLKPMKETQVKGIQMPVTVYTLVL
ncbi:adenylate cyclase [Desulfocicer vacuolatum DSM 3385]|uniref:Adenylate cyclase n=1 Tax=Desulfocicer vacuolatum DSM 3385 TaxID=1121400 RepID=A0A1W2C1M8_9BACT|nr:adenylate/guanylate cyclase domain-containing protein [Desulfocicer vacuolatum]SMC78638.1 adenylate cyclase [Desulfocicer vacuolatum DSM 3385]